MASLALRASSSTFSGLSLCSSPIRKPAGANSTCRSASIRAGEGRKHESSEILSRRSLSLAAAAALALSNQPAALAARRGGAKVEEKPKLPEDDPKLSALEKRALVKARQLEELKTKVAKEKSKASISAPAEIESNVSSLVSKAKEAPEPIADAVKKAAPVVDVAKEAVQEALPTPSE